MKVVRFARRRGHPPKQHSTVTPTIVSILNHTHTRLTITIIIIKIFVGQTNTKTNVSLAVDRIARLHTITFATRELKIPHKQNLHLNHKTERKFVSLLPLYLPDS